jgi:hypothetical protein
MTETVLDTLDGMYSWPGPRAGMTIIGARLGRLLLTTERLVFLSSGTSGIARNVRIAMTAGAVWVPVLGSTGTDQLDLHALQNDGSMTVALQLIQSAAVRRRWDLSSYIVVRSVSVAGKRTATSFMSRYGFDRGALVSFMEALERGRRNARERCG